MKKLLLILFSILISLSSYGEKVLYCQDELAQGIANTNGIWQKANFSLSRHTLKFNDDYSSVKGLINSYKSASSECNPAMGSGNEKFIVCNDNFNMGRSFRYNKDNKRYIFVQSQLFGYLDSSEDDNDWISAGTCEDF